MVLMGMKEKLSSLCEHNYAEYELEQSRNFYPFYMIWFNDPVCEYSLLKHKCLKKLVLYYENDMHYKTVAEVPNNNAAQIRHISCFTI